MYKKMSDLLFECEQIERNKDQFDFNQIIEIDSYICRRRDKWKNNEEIKLYFCRTRDDGIVYIRRKMIEKKNNLFNKIKYHKKNSLQHSISKDRDSKYRLSATISNDNIDQITKNDFYFEIDEHRKLIENNDEINTVKVVILEYYTNDYFKNIIKNGKIIDHDFLEMSQNNTLPNNNILINDISRYVFFFKKNSSRTQNSTVGLRKNKFRKSMKYFSSEILMPCENNELEIKSPGLNNIIYEYYENGILHKKDGPARIYANGMRKWYYKGQLHRKSGPTIEHPDGVRGWYYHGKHQKTEHVHTIIE
jgi:hypothetical protein